MKRRTFLKSLLMLSLLELRYALPVLGDIVQQEDADRPNVIFIVLDTFSARHASLYGYERETTPNLTRFADRATVYHRHYSTANFTAPGTASLLTGTYPWTHRALHINGIPLARFADDNLFALLADSGQERVAYTHNSLVTLLLDQLSDHIDHYVSPRDLSVFDDLLSDRLFTNDYETAFLGEKLILPKDRRIVSSSLFVSLLDTLRRERRIEQVRQEFADQFPRGIPRADQHTRYFLLEDAIDWLIEELTDDGGASSLLYAHLYPPHGPYNPRKEFVSAFIGDGLPSVQKPLNPVDRIGVAQDLLDQNRQQYDSHVLYTDAEFGRLYDTLLDNGTLDNSYLIITSDHGQLFERGVHGHITPLLYEPLIHIPLLISAPGQTTRQDVHAPTSNVDLLPTLLHLADKSIPEWVEGVVLPPFAEEVGDRPIFALEAKTNAKQGPLTNATICMIKGDHKIIRYFGYEVVDNAYELFDLSNDPEELDNLFDAEPDLAATLRAEIDAKVDAINQTT